MAGKTEVGPTKYPTTIRLFFGQFCFLVIFLGYLENPLDPLDFIFL